MESQERILKVAVELMTKEGLAALSMREVARRAWRKSSSPLSSF